LAHPFAYRSFPVSLGAATIVKHLGVTSYEPTWRAMQEFTNLRDAATPDQIWLLQHPPVYTLGLAGKAEHLLRETGIPVVRADRGGQITYHGPGQLVVYLLLDLRRRGLGVKELVRRMEQCVIELLADFAISAQRRAGAPGVYVSGAKIAALGLRVRNGCCYHGLALNVDMDLRPFDAINPCGYPGLAVTRMCDHGVREDVMSVGEKLSTKLLPALK
jgi:lipoyl(octanoyl) transferase